MLWDFYSREHIYMSTVSFKRPDLDQNLGHRTNAGVLIKRPGIYFKIAFFARRLYKVGVNLEAF